MIKDEDIYKGQKKIKVELEFYEGPYYWISHCAKNSDGDLADWLMGKVGEVQFYSSYPDLLVREVDELKQECIERTKNGDSEVHPQMVIRDLEEEWMKKRRSELDAFEKDNKRSEKRVKNENEDGENNGV